MKTEFDYCPACDLPADAFQSCGSPNCAVRGYGPGDARARRAAPAQQAGEADTTATDERALFMRAINSTYPIPNNPHNSVVQRAMDNREAFSKGWDQARTTLAPVAAQQAAAERVSCPECNGTGGVAMAGDCSDCNGKGYDWEPVVAAKAPAAQACTCVYATSANTESVRKGYEMGGYLKEECDACKAEDAASPASTPEASQQAAAMAAPSKLPKWIDDHKGADPFMDDVIAYIETLLSNQAAATTSEDARDTILEEAAQMCEAQQGGQIVVSVANGCAAAIRSMKHKNAAITALRATHQEGE